MGMILIVVYLSAYKKSFLLNLGISRSFLTFLSVILLLFLVILEDGVCSKFVHICIQIKHSLLIPAVIYYTSGYSGSIEINCKGKEKYLPLSDCKATEVADTHGLNHTTRIFISDFKLSAC